MLRQLYVHGPRWSGFWGGAELSDICAELTGAPSRFWAHHTQQCLELVDRRVESVRLMVRFVAVVGLLWHTTVCNVLMVQYLTQRLVAGRVPPPLKKLTTVVQWKGDRRNPAATARPQRYSPEPEGPMVDDYCNEDYDTQEADSTDEESTDRD